MTEKLVRALQPADKMVLVEKLAAHLPSLKRSGATSKQIEAMTRLVSERTADPNVDGPDIPRPARGCPCSLANSKPDQ
jgi:mRNA-binding protein PUF3